MSGGARERSEADGRPEGAEAREGGGRPEGSGREKPAGRIVQVSVSPGGVPKTAVARARVERGGLVGDRQAHPRIHGGPDRAVCLLAQETIDALRAEGHPIAPGTAGENVTTSGLDLGALGPGDRIALGPDVILEVVSFAEPCRQIAGSFRDGDFTRLQTTRDPRGARRYARVIVEGEIAPGDAARAVPGAAPGAVRETEKDNLVGNDSGRYNPA